MNVINIRFQMDTTIHYLSTCDLSCEKCVLLIQYNTEERKTHFFLSENRKDTLSFSVFYTFAICKFVRRLISFTAPCSRAKFYDGDS